MVRLPLQIISSQTRSVLQATKHFFWWLYANFQERWRFFLLRFIPLWLPLLLIYVLPASREIATANGFVRELDAGGLIRSRSYFSMFFQHAKHEPNNLGAQLNAIPFTLLPNQSPYDYGEFVPLREEWLRQIAWRFHEDWLSAYLVRCRIDTTSYTGISYIYSPTPPSAAMFQQRLKSGLPLLRVIEKGSKAEPRNAFWVVSRAWWEWNYAPRPFFSPPKSNFASVPWASSMTPVSPSIPPNSPGLAPPPFPVPGARMSSPSGIMFLPETGRPIEFPGPHLLPPSLPDNEPAIRKTLEILRRAHTCTYYDDGSIHAYKHMRHDRLSSSGTYLESDWLGDGLGPLHETGFLQELFSELWSTTRNPSTIRVPYAPNVPTEPPATRINPQVLVASGAAIARVGNFIDALPQQALELARRPSFEWFNTGWKLDQPIPGIGRRVTRFQTTHSQFARRARSIGQVQYTRQTLQIASQVAAREALRKRIPNPSLLVPNPTYPEELRDVDALVPPFSVTSTAICNGLGICLVSLAPLWMFLNILLARGVGTPSSHSKRWGMALALVGSLLPLSFWAMSYITRRGVFSDIIITSLLPSVIMALVVLSALGCLVVTIQRNHSRLVNPVPDKWHTRLLPPSVRPWVEPVLLGISALMLIPSEAWLTWLHLNPTNTANRILGTLPTLELAQALVIYALASGALAFLIWLINWRWPAKLVRPITHTGLRWWKETVGASICILAWLYLFVAIAAWPSRLQAKQMIEERWQLGDWVWLQKNL